MESSEAIRTAFARIQILDPENAKKLMGYLYHLNQNELIRFAFGPDTHLHNLIHQARTHLGLSSNTTSAPSSSPSYPIPLPIPFDPTPFPQSSPIIHTGFFFPRNASSPIANSWPGFPNISTSQLLSYENTRGGSLSFLNDPANNDGVVDRRVAKLENSDNTKRNSASEESIGPEEYFASRKIYLKFAPESTLNFEVLREYFSGFGPVQDVYIPNREQMMFAFVTFVSPETVKLVLERRNPHFICNSLVIVRPYNDKWKEKVLDRRQPYQQQLEMGEFAIQPYDVNPDSSNRVPTTGAAKQEEPNVAIICNIKDESSNPEKGRN